MINILRFFNRDRIRNFILDIPLESHILMPLADLSPLSTGSKGKSIQYWWLDIRPSLGASQHISSTSIWRHSPIFQSHFIYSSNWLHKTIPLVRSTCQSAWKLAKSWKLIRLQRKNSPLILMDLKAIKRRGNLSQSDRKCSNDQKLQYLSS